MTEREWIACGDSTQMLSFLRDKASDRKLRLFAVACCRRVWHLLTDRRSRRAVDAAEALADSRITSEELTSVRSDAQAAFLDAKSAEYAGEADAEFCYTPDYLAICGRLSAAIAARSTLIARLDQGIEWLYAYEQDENQWHSGIPYGVPAVRQADYWARAAVSSVERARVLVANGVTGNNRPTSRDVVTAAETAERQIEQKEGMQQAVVLRHIVGNPFRPCPVSGPWPSAVVQLATALYNGEDSAPALHDALLEVGHSELADHFRQGQQHPKGCWALDLILGKS